MIKVVVSAAATLAGGMAFAANYTSGTPFGGLVTVVSAPASIPASTATSTEQVQWINCAGEGGTCVVPGPTQVRYGAGGSFATRDATGQIACTNGVFGDPIWGLAKSCAYRAVTPPSVEWINCAGEGGTCVVPGPTQVRYGAGGTFATRDATGRIACTNGVFGDPVQGIVKSCAYRAVAPAPAPETSGSVELASIPSNFDVDKYLVPSWGTGEVAASGKPDVVGAFRFICTPSHNLYDDPVVYPGQPGRAHLHTFFGNTGANANSTYQSLRTTGESTCNNMLNRSAYWIPAMMTPGGQVVMPDYVSIYYKRRPASDPLCGQIGKACVDLPRGLRYVFGYDMATGKGAAGAAGGGYFNCDGPGAASGHFRSIPEAAKGCPAGSRLGAVISAPDCWDGKNLDSPDHRSHMAYASYRGQGYAQCPDTHPYVVPTFQLGAWYTTDATLDRSGNESPQARTWYLSSDRMPGMAPLTPGSSLHADWFGAWDDTVMKMWSANCVDKLLSCSGGDLGNGKQLRMHDRFSWTANPRLVAPPA